MLHDGKQYASTPQNTSKLTFFTPCMCEFSLSPFINGVKRSRRELIKRSENWVRGKRQFSVIIFHVKLHFQWRSEFIMGKMIILTRNLKACEEIVDLLAVKKGRKFYSNYKLLFAVLSIVECKKKLNRHDKALCVETTINI